MKLFQFEAHRVRRAQCRTLGWIVLAREPPHAVPYQNVLTGLAIYVRHPNPTIRHEMLRRSKSTRVCANPLSRVAKPLLVTSPLAYPCALMVRLPRCRCFGISPARIYPAQTGASALQLTSRSWRVQGPLMLVAEDTTAPEPTRQAQQQLPYMT